MAVDTVSLSAVVKLENGSVAALSFDISGANTLINVAKGDNIEELITKCGMVWECFDYGDGKSNSQPIWDATIDFEDEEQEYEEGYTVPVFHHIYEYVRLFCEKHPPRSGGEHAREEVKKSLQGNFIA